ncbi:exported hypothetical protein [Bradyrhizobium sp. STM 3843]|nr:exported hypothetical protein [Bradyrhizobium sp. STM 3843]
MPITSAMRFSWADCCAAAGTSCMAMPNNRQMAANDNVLNDKVLANRMGPSNSLTKYTRDSAICQLNRS